MIIFYMQAGYTFDTHEFVKAFINCKTDEEKAELLVKTFATVKHESSQIIEEKFDKAKDELSTKHDVLLVKEELRTDIKNLEIKMYIIAGGLAMFLTTVMLGILPFILKH